MGKRNGGEENPNLAGPERGDEVAAVLEDIKDLYDASGVAKHGDAGVRHGQVKGQVVGGLQCGLLPEQDEEHNAVPEPGEPTYRDQVSLSHSIIPLKETTAARFNANS